MPQGFVYILASKRNGTLYIGVTNNLSARIQRKIKESVPLFPKAVVSGVNRALKRG